MNEKLQKLKNYSRYKLKKIDLTSDDEFLVLASDGLWDVLSIEDAVQLLVDWFKAGKTSVEAADALGELALRLGSSDNVTVLIVRFEN